MMESKMEDTLVTCFVVHGSQGLTSSSSHLFDFRISKISPSRTIFRSWIFFFCALVVRTLSWSIKYGTSIVALEFVSAKCRSLTKVNILLVHQASKSRKKTIHQIHVLPHNDKIHTRYSILLKPQEFRRAHVT